jgi:uncharacterized protein (DUF433 family)
MKTDTIALPETEHLVLPRYSFAEADHLAAVSRGTTRSWLAGSDQMEAVSFLDLLEIAAAGRLKDAGFSTSAIRSMVQNCQEILGVAQPFTSLQFKENGRDIFVERAGMLEEVGRRKRLLVWKEALEPFLADLDYAHELAVRWWPLGRDAAIMIDPEYGYGLPVVEGSGVRTEIIRERSLAGDTNDQIARDFNLNPKEVERALQFELKLAA